MNRMWNNIIFPLINELKPKYIVEVGSQKGTNTMSMLEYCEKNDACLTCIDPFPLFDVDSLKSKYGEKFDMVEDLSLNVLSKLNNYDFVLLDGDHNWYTVYNELKQIERNFNQNSFPLIIFHDVSWPYARRDLYYNPENIPSEFRNEYKKKGIFPGESKLLDFGGLNRHLYNATEENTPKNGVLTAIEDFLNETNLNLTFKVLNAFNGLGFLYPENSEVDQIILEIIMDSNITGVMEEHYMKRILSLELQFIDIKKEKQKEIDALKLENKKLTEKQNELLSSNIWKITKPLRWVKNKF